MNGLIGNTPMIKIKYLYKNKIKNIYVKLEQYNLTGSIKDRIALFIINEEKKKGKLKDKMPIIEATSGNTGISFAALGAKLGHPVYIFIPNCASKERIELMKLYGAKVILISKEQGGFKKCIELADDLAKKINGYRPNQFSNNLNSLCHYKYTAEEIINSLSKEKLEGFVSGIGSGGTLMGIALKLKEKYHDIKICAVEPNKMPLLTTGEIIESHKIEGIGDEFIPDLVKKDIIDKVYDIDDNDAINMSKKLAKELGLGVGISSGANLIGAILLQEEKIENVVTIFPDDNKKYLTTDLVKESDNNKIFISNNIKLLGYEII